MTLKRVILRPHEHVLQGKKTYDKLKNSKNIDNELCYYPLLCTKSQKIQNELYLDGRKLKHDLCRETSKQTLRITFIKGPPPSTMYKNSKNIDKELGYYTLLSTQTPKIDPQQYVYQPPPPHNSYKTIERPLFLCGKIKPRIL